MTKVVLGMSMSLDGVAGPESVDADGMAIFMAILGWQFPLRSWREQQGQEGGEDSVDSRVWADTAWNSASRPSFGSWSGVQSWHHGSFGMNTPAEMGAAGSQGRRPSGAVPTLGSTERASRAARRAFPRQPACESLHKALPRRRRPSASKRPEARRSRTCRT